MHTFSPTRQEVRRATRTFLLQSPLNTLLFAAVAGMILTGLLKALDAGNFIIGFSNFMVMGAGLAQVFSSPLAERWLRRRPLLTAFYWGRFLALLIPGLLILGLTFGLPVPKGLVIGSVLFGVGTSHLLFSLAYPIWFSWATDLLPPQVKGGFFGRLQAAGQFVQAIMIVGLGWGLQRAGEHELLFYALFWIFAASGQVIGASLNRGLVDPPMVPSEHGNRFLQNVVQIFHLPQYRRLLLLCSLFNFGVMVASTFGIVYFRDVLELGWWPISIIAAAWTLAFGLSSPLWGLLIDRMGNSRVLICLSLGIWSMSCIGNLVVQPQGLDTGWITLMPTPVMIFLAVLGGIGFGGWFVSITHLQSELTPQANRTMLVGCFNAIAAIAGAVGSLFIGFCIEHLGLETLEWNLMGLDVHYFQLLYGLNALLMVLLMAGIFTLRWEGENNRLILSTVFGGGLLQTVFNVWRFHQMEDEGRMVRLVRKSSTSSSGRLLLPDLLRRLDDASHQVRAEAIYALGRLGDERAVPSLLELLEDSTSALEIEIVWALGQIGDSRAIEPLLQLLHHPSSDISRRAATALGQLDLSPSDECAMLSHFTSDHQPNTGVFLSIVESLLDRGRWDDLKPHLLQAYLNLGHGHRRLRHRLALDLAHAHGCRKEFYRSLRDHEREPGSAFDRLAGDERWSLLFSGQVPNPDPKVLMQRCLALMDGDLTSVAEHFSKLESPDEFDALLVTHLLTGRHDKGTTKFIEAS